VNKVEALVGSEPAKARLGVVPNAPTNKSADGPAAFRARRHGKRGQVLVSSTATTPCVSFEYEGTASKPEPELSIAIDDIRELRKVGGLGWKSKLVIGWAMDTEVMDGLEIVDVTGKAEKFTAIPRRDELFNRLVAMGTQKWESW
jgi:Protein of unknown function (DUF3292)